MNFKANLIPHQPNSKYLGKYYEFTQDVGDEYLSYRYFPYFGEFFIKDDEIINTIEDEDFNDTTNYNYPSTTLRFYINNKLELFYHVDEFKDMFDISINKWGELIIKTKE